jgi:hypothetical protein
MNSSSKDSEARPESPGGRRAEALSAGLSAGEMLVPHQPHKTAAMRLKLAAARTEHAHRRRADDALRRFSWEAVS